MKHWCLNAPLWYTADNNKKFEKRRVRSSDWRVPLNSPLPTEINARLAVELRRRLASLFTITPCASLSNAFVRSSTLSNRTLRVVFVARYVLLDALSVLVSRTHVFVICMNENKLS